MLKGAEIVVAVGSVLKLAWIGYEKFPGEIVISDELHLTTQLLTVNHAGTVLVKEHVGIYPQLELSLAVVIVALPAGALIV